MMYKTKSLAIRTIITGSLVALLVGCASIEDSSENREHHSKPQGPLTEYTEIQIKPNMTEQEKRQSLQILLETGVTGAKARK